MKLTIVYDDIKNKGTDVISDHGFSCYIETDQEVILFDTGTDGEILLHNMKNLGKDPKKISKIVISHEHQDHSGGLPELLEETGSVTVYRIGNEKSTDSVHYVQVKEALKISENIWSTGRLPGEPRDEQSLILKGSQGFFVLAGCSHSGVENILQAAKNHGDIVGLIGGFHGFDTFSVLDGLEVIYPCHCTVHKQKIRRLYPNNSRDCSVGTSIEI